MTPATATETTDPSPWRTKDFRTLFSVSALSLSPVRRRVEGA